MFKTLDVWVAALWWGALTAVGAGVVPMLFAHLPTPAMAGTMAAKLFSALTWLAWGCGLILLVFFRLNQPLAQVNKAQSAIIFILVGVLAASLSEFAVAPHIVARENLRVWHSLGTLLYVLQWVCATITFKKLVTLQSTKAA